MTYEKLGDRSLDYLPCRYGRSKLLFRGPRRRLEGGYVAFLGGTETYGKFIEVPFPALLEARTGLKCVNFGWPNAGVDVFLNETEVLGATRGAQATVVQIPPAQNMSNRFYSVHPRRNDRFLEPSALLRTVYREVDFTEFHFTRHLLSRLREISPERFAMVREELQNAWISRMRLLIDRIRSPVILLWFSGHAPRNNADLPDIAEDPSFVSREMIETLRPAAAQVVEATASAEAQAQGTRGMVFAPMEEPAAAELLGPLAHAEAADALIPVLSDHEH